MTPFLSIFFEAHRKTVAAGDPPPGHEIVEPAPFQKTQKP
jgi:hypothetical protein